MNKRTYIHFFNDINKWHKNEEVSKKILDSVIKKKSLSECNSSWICGECLEATSANYDFLAIFPIKCPNKITEY